MLILFIFQEYSDGFVKLQKNTKKFQIMDKLFDFYSVFHML